MAERVQGMDAAMLEMESPTMHLHMVGVLVLDPSTAPGPWSADRVVQVYAERMHLLPPFHKRVVEVPGRLDHPRWIDDPDFDLDRHIFHLDVGPDAPPEELERFAGELASRPLRREVPLWEVWILEGFRDGSVALISKVHHALMDGSAGSDIMASLFDTEPSPPPDAPAPALPREQPPSRGRLLAEAVPANLGRVARLPLTVARTVSSVAGSAKAVAAQPSSLLGFAPRTRFNGPLTPSRTVAFRRCSLDDLRSVGRVFGVTVNDVVLAATAMAMREYLVARGEPPDEPLVASVPVDGRHDGEIYGNHTSNIMVALPAHLDDPVELLRAVHEDALGAKAAKGALDSRVIDAWTSVLPARLLSGLTGLYSSLELGRHHPPVFTTIVSNVAGPPMPLYLAGARLVALYPMGPLIANSGLNLTVLSHDGVVDVGIIACPDLVDDIGALADGFVQAVSTLVGLSGRAGGNGQVDGRLDHDTLVEITEGTTVGAGSGTSPC